jgi:FkbM family methyltransferase
LRAWANAWLVPRGLELTHRRLENDPMRQLGLALRHHAIDLVIDVGANAGQFARELLHIGYEGDVHSIEPLPDAHRQLQHAAATHTRWTVHERLAVGNSQGEVEMIVAGNSLSSSVLPMLERHAQAAPQSRPVGRVRVQQTTLDRLYGETLSAQRSVLLKIDTQGYEPQVLRGAAATLARVRLVQLELSLQPLYEGQQLWLEVMETLRSRGFDIWSLHPEFCDPHSGQLLQVNALFSRVGGGG